MDEYKETKIFTKLLLAFYVLAVIFVVAFFVKEKYDWGVYYYESGEYFFAAHNFYEIRFTPWIGEKGPSYYYKASMEKLMEQNSNMKESDGKFHIVIDNGGVENQS